MERDGGSPADSRRHHASLTLPFELVGIESFIPHQLELFPPEALRKTGSPIRIVVRDPNRPDQSRTMIVASPNMRQLIEVLQQAAPTNETVLLLGESGTGKNWLAWLLHSLSHRRNRPFVELNASLLPEGLLDSTLFGHEKGAFTGALEAQPGRLALAEGGTLFINEAGDLSPSSQLKLLRFLDDRVYERVGGSCVRVADVRVVAATHRDLRALVKEGKFREDLYYRLNVVSIRVPALRERPGEIPAMAEAMLQEVSQSLGKPWLRWTSEALESLTRRPWIGNIRALKNLIVQAAILCKSPCLGSDDLPVETLISAEGLDQPRLSVDHEEKRRRFVQAYEASRGNRSAIARILGTSRTEIRRKIQLYGLEL